MIVNFYPLAIWKRREPYPLRKGTVYFASFKCLYPYLSEDTEACSTDPPNYEMMIKDNGRVVFIWARMEPADLLADLNLGYTPVVVYFKDDVRGFVEEWDRLALIDCHGQETSFIAWDKESMTKFYEDFTAAMKEVIALYTPCP
ncbi:hypothetical protein BJ085DRAFT_29917 [Dimargaris cristalligena]|uniref:Uncharacterized protein n=1 Tax=Dimargaris cristalligena TaxID=215637 RepID=A0A4P9ZQJ5_9FUNG|nr:hypothetical protein BJ085DRAFT_29917 [Dimargaris cristalligena]|eukprot:RKP34680.1 hypothetical protein BJ085DRAFT_29917 [Dimargaris cristalligena]